MVTSFYFSPERTKPFKNLDLKTLKITKAIQRYSEQKYKLLWCVVVKIPSLPREKKHDRD